jgi:hypothetical protein
MLTLSPRTAQRVQWNLASDTARLLLAEVDTERGRAATSERPVASSSEFAVNEERVRRAFEQAKLEFSRVLGPTRKGMQWSLAIAVIALAVTVAGAALSFLNPWGGGLVSLAGLGVMLGYLRRAWMLNRDQLLLELVPARYELALTLARTKEQYAQILRTFLKETDSLHSK